MIVFDLQCRDHAHRFEGWFGSSDDFARQQERGLVSCPNCGSTDIIKAPMTPNLGRKGNQRTEVPAAAVPPVAAPSVPAPPTPVPPTPVQGGKLPPETVKMFQALATLQAEALKSSRWVGGTFVEESRAMHYGEKDAEAIHGEATPEEARALRDEGIEVAPLLFPVAPPDKTN